MTGGVDHQPDTSQVVADDPVLRPALDHVGRHVGLGAVDEAGLDIAGAVQLGDRIQLVLV